MKIEETNIDKEIDTDIGSTDDIGVGEGERNEK